MPDFLPSTKRKLQPPFIGPYRIVEKLTLLNYRLKLPPSFKIHDVFHISQLKQYKDTSSFPGRHSPQPPAPFRINSADYYKVDRLLGHRRRRGQDYYLVAWKGYAASDNSWEPSTNITPDLLTQYHALHGVRSPTGV